MRLVIRIVLALLTAGVLWTRAPELRAALGFAAASGRAGACSAPQR
jgi:hypothetical protein